MTDPRPTPMDRAPHDPTAPLLGPGQWHCEPPSFRKGDVPAPRGIGRGSMRSWTLLRVPSMRACAI